MYGEFLRNLKRGTTFVFRHRDRRGVRRFRSTEGGLPVMSNRRRVPVTTGRQLLVLAGPGLAVSAVGVLALLEGDIRGWPRVTVIDAWAILFCAVTLALVARSLAARAPWWIRLVALAANLVYPIVLVLRIRGVV